MKNALVAVSGGSDSLALLNMLLEENKYNLIVCHVNYNYRDSSKRDEEIVRRYCNNKNISLYVLNLDSKVEKEGNFENWARVKRYQFFKEIYDKENCQCLFVGHHKDDVIETYFLQKKRKSIVEYYGLNEVNNIQGMKVVRPLLNYSKKELEDYCVKHELEYGIDETNFDLNYSRNKIRFEVISLMGEAEKDKIIKEIKELNQDKIKHLEEIRNCKSQCLIEDNVLDLAKFNILNEDVKREVLYYFLIDNLYQKISIKKSRLEDIIKKIDSDKPNIILAKYDNYVFYKEYNCLVIDKNNREYCYKIENIENKNISEEYCIKESGKKLEKIEVSKEDFPLYLRNYDGKNKTVNRIFINKKVPLRLRKNWPVIVNKFDELLLVIGIKKFYNKIWDASDNPIEFYVCKK